MAAKNVILISIFFIFLATGCKNTNHAATIKAPSISLQKAVARDLSINHNNAYNDIFLDSTDVEKFILKEKLNDTLSTAMHNFYNARNYEFAWFAGTGLIEQALSFRSLYSSENDSDVFNKSLEARLDKLRMDEDSSVTATDPATIRTELQITERLIRYDLDNYKLLHMSQGGLGLYIPAKKTSIAEAAASLLGNTDDNKSYASLNEPFRLLKVPLKQYDAITRNGGWPTIAGASAKYKPGAIHPSISVIKKRLQITGELTGGDSSTLFDPALEAAVKTYQLNHGYKPTGEISAALIKDLNIPAIARVEQLLINMQRRRWMPVGTEPNLILINIPEFELYADSGKTTLFQMDVVVGAEAHNTTMFSGNVNQVVFSPYWNIPPSIVKKEVVPGMRRDKNYLAKRDMEITGTENGLPVVRQRPGSKNALGKVKFLFPNSFNIYMHDTPQKEFFNRSERGLSHGCIRLSNPVKMADYLLRNSPFWTPEKIDSAMNSGKEKFVKLPKPVPVIISYYTAWVDGKGTLHFADDIYGHDKQMSIKMFTNTQ